MNVLLKGLALNAALALAYALVRALPNIYLTEPEAWLGWIVAWNAAWLLLSVAMPARNAGERGERIDQRLGRAFFEGGTFVLFFVGCVALAKLPMPGRRRLLTFFVLAPLALAVVRFAGAALLAAWRRRTGKAPSVAFVGDAPALLTLEHTLAEDGVIGKRLTFAEAEDYLRSHPCDALYCSLAKETLAEAHALFDFCENHLVRFYGVPEVTEYFDRNLLFTAVDDTPVLTPRDEPLRRLSNRILKRSLDIVISLGFLTTLFVPILIFVAWKIKRESPGPIFFRQRRHGLDGREFRCWKFRSMHVNDQSDTAQTAVDDPRKFPFGDKMRRTNIDELPQFINVLLGDMSVVGPRPHPCKMTDDYGAIVNRYRVRLYAKPGVTGWAQVNGARGATLTIGDMIRRVRLDIWYLEHWTFWLDLRIIFATFWQTVSGKNKNAF